MKFLLLYTKGYQKKKLLKPNWVFHDRRFCQIIWQIFTQGRAKKISSKISPSGNWNQDLQIFRPMPYQLS